MDNLINEFGEIIRWPKKPSDKDMVIIYLGTKFVFLNTYTEKQVNAIISKHHTFNDVPLLRRELVSRNILSREDDGSLYWKVN